MALSNSAVTVVLQALKSITSHPDQCFTAYDVTKLARSLTTERIHHDEVRDLIHAFYDQGLMKQYQRLPHNFWQNGRQVQAQIFCPPNGDILAYDPDEVQFLDHSVDEEDLDEDQDLDFDDFDDASTPQVLQSPIQPQPALVGATPDISNDPPKAAPKLLTSESLPDPLTVIKEKIKGKLSKLSNMFWGV